MASAEALAFVAPGAFVAGLFVSLPAAPAAGSVVALPPEPPVHPETPIASAAQIAYSSEFTRDFCSFNAFIFVFLSLWFSLEVPRLARDFHPPLAGAVPARSRGQPMDRANQSYAKCCFLAVTSNKRPRLQTSMVLGEGKSVEPRVAGELNSGRGHEPIAAEQSVAGFGQTVVRYSAVINQLLTRGAPPLNSGTQRINSGRDHISSYRLTRALPANGACVRGAEAKFGKLYRDPPGFPVRSFRRGRERSVVRSSNPGPSPFP